MWHTSRIACVGEFRTTLLPPAGSVRVVPGPTKLAQHVVSEVECAEAHADGDGALDPVHAQPLVEAAGHALRGDDVAQGAHQGAVAGATGDPGRLHAPAHHVQRVGRRLADHARARPKHQPLVGVRLGALRLLWRGRGGI